LREAVQQHDRRSPAAHARKDAPGLSVDPVRGEAGEEVVGHRGFTLQGRQAGRISVLAKFSPLNNSGA
jgi:hypothetical protein